MPYRIKVEGNSVYHNGRFVKSNPPELTEYLELMATLQSIASPTMDKEPGALTDDELRAYGQKLFASLFGDLPCPDEPVLLEIDPPVRTMIPYEIMHDGKGFISQTIGLARAYQRHEPYCWKPVTRQLSVLAAFAGPLMYRHIPDPEDTNQPDSIPVRYAADTFDDAINSANIPAAFTFRRHLTRDELQRELKNNYHVFYFTGHGSYRGILLEDPHGYADPVDTDWLKRYFRRHDFRLAVMNSCDTARMNIEKSGDFLKLTRRFVDVLHELNIPFTIGMQFSIQQRAGNSFMKAFYRSLVSGASFLEAVQEAREDMAEEARSGKFPAWQCLIPVAHVHADMIKQADTRHIFTSDLSLPALPPAQPDIPEKFSYRRNDQFTGRRQELIDALQVLDPEHGQKVLMLHGEGGMGKTALAIELAYRTSRWYRKAYWASGRKQAVEQKLGASLGDREVFSPIESDNVLFDRLADEIGCKKSGNVTETIRNIHEALRNDRPALVILDNLENFRDVPNLHHLLHQLPTHCKAILTSRIHIEAEKPIYAEVPVRPLKIKDAFHLMMTIAEDLKLNAWWAHYQKIYEVSKGHPQTIQILTGKLKNKTGFFQWIDELRKLDKEGQSLFLYIFGKKLDEIGVEGHSILYALSLFDEPVDSSAIRAVCKDDFTSEAEFNDHLNRLVSYRFIEIVDKDRHTLQALVDFLIQQKLKEERKKNRSYRCRLIQFWQREGNREKEAEEFYRLASLLNDYQEWSRAASSLAKAEAMFREMAKVNNSHKVNVGKTASLRGMICFQQGNWDKAIKFYEESLAIDKSLDDRQGMAAALVNLGSVYLNRGNWDEAIKFYKKSLEIQKSFDDRQGMAAALVNLGSVYLNRGNWDEAIKFYKESLAIAESLDDRQGMAAALGNLGSAYANKVNWDEAIKSYEESLAIKKSLGDRQGMANTLGNLGSVYLNQGNLDKV